MDADAHAPSGAGDRRAHASLPVAAAALALALLHVLAWGGRWPGIDYFQFWVVGQAVREPGTGDVYSQAERERLGALHAARAAEEVRGLPRGAPVPLRAVAARQREVLETYSTPWLYTLVGAFSSGDYERDLARFQGLSLLAYAAALLLFVVVLGVPASTGLLCALIFLAWFGPLSSGIHVGNVNRLQLLFVALVAWCLSRRFRGATVLAGAVLGQAVAFKPNLAFAAVALGGGWALLGRWRRLLALTGGALGGAAAAVLLSSAWFGSARAWLTWAAEVPRLLRDYDHSIAKGNYALPELLEHLVGRSPGSALSLLLLALALAAAARLRKPTRAGDPLRIDALLLALGCAVSALGAGLAWLHYFQLLIPLALWCLRAPGGVPGGTRGTRGLAGVAILLIALDPQTLPGASPGTPAAAALVSGGALLLLALALVQAFAPARAEDLARGEPAPALR